MTLINLRTEQVLDMDLFIFIFHSLYSGWLLTSGPRLFMTASTMGCYILRKTSRQPLFLHVEHTRRWSGYRPDVKTHSSHYSGGRSVPLTLASPKGK